VFLSVQGCQGASSATAASEQLMTMLERGIKDREKDYFQVQRRGATGARRPAFSPALMLAFAPGQRFARPYSAVLRLVHRLSLRAPPPVLAKDRR
jgi:hypothetical protein